MESMDESKNRIPSTAGWVKPEKLPIGPNGRALCRRCSQEVPKGRRTFCGETCVGIWKLDHDPSLQRELIFKRDKGVCKTCNTDTEVLKKSWSHLTAHWSNYEPNMEDIPYPHFTMRKDDTTPLEVQLAARRSITAAWEKEKTSRIIEYKKLQERDEQDAHRKGFTTKHLWEMDHIIEVVMGGGGGFDATNCQTLCIPCHHKKTAQLAKTRAILRKLSAGLVAIGTAKTS